jgi:hypothetical protein
MLLAQLIPKRLRLVVLFEPFLKPPFFFSFVTFFAEAALARRPFTSEAFTNILMWLLRLRYWCWY